MKNVWKGLGFLTLCLSLSTIVQAQEKDKDKDKYKPVIENDKDKDKASDRVSDKDMNEQLSQNLYSRNPAAKDAVIVWDNNDEGYDATYVIGDVNYMTRYDRDGNYVETLTGKKWDDNVPSNVRRSFDNSIYKSNKVERFWEVNEPGKQGYYLEIKDDDGNPRRIWSDKDGKFSEPPHKEDNNQE